MFKELFKSSFCIGVGLAVQIKDTIRSSPKFYIANPLACGVTVLGTGRVKRIGDIHIHDHDVLNPQTRKFVPGDAKYPVVAFGHPDKGLVIERYNQEKHGNIDWGAWNNEGDQTPDGEHKHLTGGACLP